MSARGALHAAIVAALQADPMIAELATRVFDAPAARAAVPWLLVEEAELTDWSTKTISGREGRIAIRAEDAGERPERLREIADAVCEVLPLVARDLGEGWRIVTLVPLRSRIRGVGSGRWMALIEARVRMLRVN